MEALAKRPSSPPTPKPVPPPEGYWRFNFFQLMRLLEQSLPRGLRLGLDTLPTQEPLRVLPDPALRYPAADISFYGQAAARGEPPYRQPKWMELRVTFGGLYGVQSPLPYHFLDDIARQVAGADALASFLDIFNHRLYLLQYQAWKKYRHAQQYEAGARDRISACLLGLGGLALPGSEKQAQLPIGHLLAYLGPFSQRVRNAEGLRAVVAEYLGGPVVTIEQLAEHWVTLSDIGSIAVASRGGTLRIGDNIVLGKRVQDPAGKVRVRIGPLGVQRFFECMPGGKDFKDLAALVRLYLGAHIEFDLCLRLRTEDLPPAQLRRAGTPGALRIGWTSLLGNKLPALVDVHVRNCTKARSAEISTSPH